MIILDTMSLVTLVTVDDKSDDAARFQGLLTRAKEGGVSIGVPAPVFAEFLVKTNDATTEMLLAVERKRGLRILPFDKRVAHECALLDRAAIAGGNKKGASTQSWQRVKIDRQILAIARANNATLLLTSDTDMTSMANRLGLNVQKVVDLPIPDDRRQTSLSLMGDTPSSTMAPGDAF
jgi:predicted nucleic acid-binding protein